MSKKQKKMLYRIIASAVVLVAGILTELTFSGADKGLLRIILPAVVFCAAYIIVGWDILWKSCRNIANGQIFDENFLMSVASLGAMAMGEFHEGVAVMLLYQVGELFQSYAVGKSRKSISDMMDINPEFANIERNGEIIEVEPGEVAVGDIIVVKPGERVPLDGEVVFGSCGLNTSALTGESALREVTVGDEVISGCINTNGVIKIKVSKPYEDSTVAKILELVENSTENKAKTESFITKFARVYTPIVVFAALAVGLIPPAVISLAGGALAGGELWLDWIHRALTFLVVSCPCALVISVPLSYFGGIGGASRCGIMVKGANFLEALAKADIFVFDKTGTLTRGSFSVSEVLPENGMTQDELLSCCAAAERFSNHPIALSIVSAAGRRGSIPAAENAEEIAGFGIVAQCAGKTVAAGNARLMEKLGVAFRNPESVGTVVHCAVDGKYAGCVIITDEIKAGAKSALAELKKLGASRTVMLTGDRKAAGEAVAAQVGIDEVHTELLPDAKVCKVEELCAAKSEKSSLVYVGDGINDAPSLARADVGIAMGGLGSDAAIEAADIVLMNDNLDSLSLAVGIARKTHTIVMQNIVFALTVKIAVLVIAALGFDSMWLAVMADVGVAVLAILNAMRAMKAK